MNEHDPKQSSHSPSVLRSEPQAGAGWRQWLPALALSVLATCCYLPALRGGYVLDDDVLLTHNPLIKSSDGLFRIWFTTEPVDYWPLTNTTFWCEWRLWGLNPVGYHVGNLVLHIAGALLIWAILRKLSIPGAWLAALLFAIHPVNVESVAWISQRKNVLSLVFFLLAILSYLKADRGAGLRRERSAERRWYVLSLLAFTLAMLSKGSVVMLPVVLLLLAWWQRGSITSRDLARTTPFFIVAIALTALNIWFQTHGSGEVFRVATFGQRLLGAGAVVWFYLYKALLPVNLVFIYPQWNIEVGDWRWWLPLLAAVLVTAVLLGQRHSRFARPLLFAWLFFCLALLPVMGFTDVGFMKYSLVADRYQHIAIIGVLALLAAGCTVLFQRMPAPARSASMATAVAAAAALAFLSWQQSSLYADAVTLYEATLLKNQDSWMIHNNLGIELAGEGRAQEAIEHFRRILQIRPNSAEAQCNLGNALLRAGLVEEALAHFHQALRLDPDHMPAVANLAMAYAQSNRPADAVATAQKAIQLARSQGQTALTQQLEAWLNSYRAQLSKRTEAPLPRSKATPPPTLKKP